jgi:hypothetical protein
MQRSSTPGVFAVLGVLLLLAGIVPNWWFTGSPRRPDLPEGIGASPEFDEMMDSFTKLQVKVGLRDLEMCNDGCIEIGLGDFVDRIEAESKQYGDDPLPAGTFDHLERYMLWANLTFFGGLLAVGVLAVAIGAWIARARLPVPIGAIGAGLAVIVLITATVALIVEPDLPAAGSGMEGLLELRMGLGFPLTLFGCIGCAVGGYQMMREPGYVRGGGITPPCPRCGGPTEKTGTRNHCSSCHVYF